MMITKKAQMQQMFIYLSAILVIGFLVLFGYRMIDRLMEQKCTVEEQTFYTSIGKNIDKSTRFGSRTEAKITRPCDFDKVCFVNTNNITEKHDINTPYNLINLNTEDGIEYNVYLIDEGVSPIVVPVLYDARITTRNTNGEGSDFVCLTPTNGQFVFWLEGLGKNGVYLYTQ